ncbi:tautomerase family protein [Chitinimonas sp.]|uniref:tautomerase family protein n=1 Tax=Chitinimonas sp. TaxID=1934313 RepID=UPI0035B0EAE0
MPLVRIALPAGTTAATQAAIADAIHTALVATFAVPADDRFQLIDEYAPSQMICTASYLGIAHSSRMLLIQVFASFGRDTATKKALFRAIAENVQQGAGWPAADVFIHFV